MEHSQGFRRFPEKKIPGIACTELAEVLPELACTELVEVSKATANLAFDRLRQRYIHFWKSPYLILRG
jgi:hypothetical protein